MTRDSLIDSSVIIDVLAGQEWQPWSADTVASARAEGRLVVSPVVIAELAGRFRALADLEKALAHGEFEPEQLPWEAAFLAGRAFSEYRRRGGPRTTVLPDLLIGAHAAVSGYRVITRDRHRFRSYFPGLEVITP